MRSGKYITGYLALLLVIIMSLSGTASALTESFEAFGEKTEINVCACDLKTDTITVQNTGDVTSTFMLNLGGDAAEWANIAPQSFYLEPSEAKQIERFVKVPCGARGEYVLNTTIKTLFDLEKVMEQKVNVENCNNILIAPKFSGTQEECPCTPVQYSFEVVNIGQHTETYEISVEPYSEAISLSSDLLILEPGQKETVDVFINLECGQYGEKIFTFNAKAQGTGLLGQTDFALNINKCYDYELAGEEQYAICRGVPNIMPFQLNNKANVANKYFITVESEEGLDWAYPENDTIDAWGGEAINSNILAFPPADDEASHEITIKSLSTRGGEERTKTLVFETQRCYDYELIDNGEFNAIECVPKSHTYTLRNIGSREAAYLVELTGLDWVTTTASELRLLPGEEVEVMLNAETPCGVLGAQLENIYVTIEDINQTFVEEKTLSVFTKEDAYLPEIDVPELTVGYEGGEAEIRLENAGFETAEYVLTLTASDWLTIDTSTVTLAPGENATVLLQAYPTEDVVEDTYAAELTAKVGGEEIEYTTDFTVEVGENNNLVIYALIGGAALLLIIIIIVLILVLRKKKKLSEKKEEKKVAKEAITIDKREYRRQKKEERKTRIWPILLAILIIAALGAAAYYAFSTGLVGGERNETTSNETVEEAAEWAVEEPVETPVTQPEPVPEETPAPEAVPSGVLTNADIEEALITIDRSNVAGEGNELQIGNETELTLPMSIKNPTDRKAILTVQTQEGSWVQFDREKITVMPESTEIINVKILPDLAALEENDYSIKINTTLEGKKIYYEEELDFVVTKQSSTLKTLTKLWPWLVIGLIVLVIILLIIKIATREKKPEIKAAKAEKKEKVKAAKERPARKQEKEGTSWSAVFIGLIIILIIAGVGFWAYNTFQQPETSEENATEEVVEETPVVEEQTAPAETAPPEEPKLTEEDVEESLVTIDRSGVPGEGNILELEQDQYSVPLSIKNPTDRKARFTVSTSNESWIVFDQYKIVVEPESETTANMTIVPDKEALKTNDYAVTINTKLEGQKIDYEEQIDFVLKQKRAVELSYLAYALIGLILIGIVILAAEIVKRAKAAKKTTRKETKAKKTEKKERGLDDINKEIEQLRKKTILQLKKSSY